MKHFYLGAMAVAGCVSLTACVSFANMDAGLQRLMGHDVHDAIDVIGYPTSQAEIAGDTVYDWYVQSNGMIYQPTSTYTTGYVGSTAVSGQTYSGTYVPMQWSCKVRMAARDGRLVRWEYNGQRAACAPIIRQLEAWMKRG